MKEVAGLEKFGQWVADRREKLGLTQAELAQRAGNSTTTISNLERGVTRPQRTTLQVLALALQVPHNHVTAALKGKPLPPPPPLVTLELPQDVVRTMNRLADDFGMSPSEWVSRLVRWAADSDQMVQAMLRSSMLDGRRMNIAANPTGPTHRQGNQ